MTFGTILALVTLVAFVGVLPVWPWSRKMSAKPAIIAGLCLAAAAIFVATDAV